MSSAQVKVIDRSDDGYVLVSFDAAEEGFQEDLRYIILEDRHYQMLRVHPAALDEVLLTVMHHDWYLSEDEGLEALHILENRGV